MQKIQQGKKPISDPQTSHSLSSVPHSRRLENINDLSHNIISVKGNKSALSASKHDLKNRSKLGGSGKKISHKKENLPQNSTAVDPLTEKYESFLSTYPSLSFKKTQMGLYEGLLALITQDSSEKNIDIINEFCCSFSGKETAEEISRFNKALIQLSKYPGGHHNLLTAGAEIVLAAVEGYTQLVDSGQINKSLFPFELLDEAIYIKFDLESLMKMMTALSGAEFGSPELFLEWVGAPEDKDHLLNPLLNLSFEKAGECKEAIHRLFTITKTHPDLPIVAFAEVLVNNSGKELMHLLDLVEAGDTRLAVQLAKRCMPLKEKSLAFAHFLLRQEAIVSEALLFLERFDRGWIKAHPYIPFGRKEVKKILDPKALKQAILTQYINTITKNKGCQQFLNGWMAPFLEEQTDSMDSAAKFLRMSSDVQELTISLLSFCNSSDQQMGLLRALQVFPSHGFALALLEDLRSQYKRESTEHIEILSLESGNQHAVLEIAEGLIAHGKFPEPPQEYDNKSDKEKVINYLKRNNSSWLTSVRQVFDDTSDLGQEIASGVIDWILYHQARKLKKLFENKLPYKKMSKEEQSCLLHCLNLGRTGYMPEVMSWLSRSPSPLCYRAIVSGGLLSEPELLQEVLEIDENTSEGQNVLKQFIKAPKDNWCRFLIHIESKKESFPDALEVLNDPDKVNALKEIVASGRLTLAEKALSSKDGLEKVIEKIEASPKAKLKPVSRIIAEWRSLHADHARVLKSKRKDSVSQQALRRKIVYRERNEETSLALSIAKTIISQGTIKKSSLISVMNKIPGKLSSTHYEEHLIRVCSLLINSKDLCDRVTFHHGLEKLSSAGEAIIRGLLRLKEDKPILPEHISVTLLSALLSQPRQETEEGACFVAAQMVRLSQTAKGLTSLLSNYIEILETGGIVIFSSDGEEKYIPVVADYLHLDLKRYFEHPLVKALEAVLGVLGLNKDDSLLGKMEDAIFNDKSGFLSTRINSYFENIPESATIPTKEVLIEYLTRYLNRSFLVVMDPGSTFVNGRSLSWVLLDRTSHQPIRDVKSYLSLCVGFIDHAFKGMYQSTSDSVKDKPSVIAEIASNLEKIRAEIVSWIVKDEGLTFIKHMCDALAVPDSEIDGLWSELGDGGDVGSILRQYYGGNRVFRYVFSPRNTDEVVDKIVEYCLRLRKSDQESGRISVGMPKHAIVLLPKGIVDKVKSLEKDTDLTTKIKESLSSIADQPCSIKWKADLTDSLLLLLNRYFHGEMAVVSERIATVNSREDITVGEWAQEVLKAICLSRDRAINVRRAARFVEKVLWNHGEVFPSESPFVAFADANWVSKNHHNNLLAFGPSLSMNKIEVFVMESGDNITLLPWDPLSNEWEMYTPAPSRT